MRVELAPGIAHISGSTKTKTGKRIIFKTYTRLNGKRETRMYMRTAESFERKSPITKGEIAARNLFAKRIAYVNELVATGKCKSRTEAWQIAKQTIK